ncbi:MAG: hypothetical protein CMA27_03825 [Euryarchaeota archaeon]|nr:hypothetical protein [Euryarchaeota archaeon]
MSGDSSEKLRKLLDGELDLSEAANDPILASLASRIYNIDMADVQPSKELSVEGIEKSNLSFELHDSSSPEALEMEMPELPPLGIPTIEGKEEIEAPKILKISSLLMIGIGPIISLCSILNIFGVFGFLKSCETIVANNGYCIDGADRLSWLAIGRLNHMEGWIYSGYFGIPTIVMILFGVVIMFVGIQLRMFSKN